MSGALSIPFAFLALFNLFSGRFLFAALAYASLWVLVIAQYRRICELTVARFKLIVSPGYRIRPHDPNSVFIHLSLSFTFPSSPARRVAAAQQQPDKSRKRKCEN